MKKVWVTADLHIAHKNIIKYENRPFYDLSYMDIILVNNINQLVEEDDILWNLGDFVFGGAKKIQETTARIKCKNHRLIKGNHDDSRNQQWYLDKGFSYYSKYPVIYHGILLSHEPQPYYMGLNIHGHLHSNDHRLPEFKFIGKKHKCVSVELTEYKPVLLGYYEKREFVQVLK